MVDLNVEFRLMQRKLIKELPLITRRLEASLSPIAGKNKFLEYLKLDVFGYACW